MRKHIIVVGCADCPNSRQADVQNTQIDCGEAKNKRIGRTIDFILRTPEWCPLADTQLTHTDRDVDAVQCIWEHMMNCYALVAPDGDCGFPDISPHEQFMFDLLIGDSAAMREMCRDSTLVKNLLFVHDRIKERGIKTDFADDFVPWFMEHCLVWELEPVERFMSFRTNWEEQSLHKLKREG